MCVFTIALVDKHLQDVVGFSKIKERCSSMSSLTSFSLRKTFNLLVLLFSFLAATPSAYAQAAQYTAGKADQTLKGSGRINPATNAMEFTLPLGNYPGRGISVPITLSYSSKLWHMDYVSSSVSNTGNCFSLSVATFGDQSASGWTTSLRIPYIEYKNEPYDVEGNVYRDDVDLACNPRGGGTSFIQRYVKRILLHLPSGETHELRATDTIQGTASFEGTFYSVDSSNIVYVQDTANNIFRAKMPDGSYYDFNGTTHLGTRYTDRNGNYTEFHSGTYTNGYWADTLGREIPVPIGQAAPTSAGTQTYEIPGLGGQNPIEYTLHWKQLKGSTAGESALTDFNDSLRYYSNYSFANNTWQTRSPGTYLFEGEYSSRITPTDDQFNPILLTEVELPTGGSYKFSYNVWGEIDRIEYPTGGVETFSYDTVPANAFLDGPYDLANRGVVNRKVYESSTDSTPYEWTYSFPSNGSRHVTNPDGTQIETWYHQSSSFVKYGFDSVLAGMPYRQLAFTSDDHIVSQKLTHWTKTGIGTDGAEWHPRVDYEETIVYDSSGNGISATTLHEYNGDLSYKETPVLENKTTSYAFVSAASGSSLTPGGISTMPSVPSATPTTTIRVSEVTYLIDDPNYAGVKSYYTAQNINGLVTVAKVKDGSATVVSQSEMVYDETGSSPGYRGNPTTAKVWDSAKGAVSSSTNFISTHAAFDSYGNQTSSTDALGNTTTTTFDSTYHAFPISVTSPIPDSTGTYGSSSAFTTSGTFDISTGLPLTTTDANGLTTEITYDTTTLRPRYKKFYKNYGIAGQTQVGPTNETIYNDESGNYWVKQRNQLDSVPNYAESITYFDGLGRAWKTEQVNSNGNIFTEKEFDSEGRVLRVCNPYRSGETKQWTSNTYDTASRVISVTLPDSSTIATTYGLSTSSPLGVKKTITDQSGRKRSGITDAAGNMVRVIEDPDNAAYVTDYVFDTLGNLRKTAQGGQYRYFMHSSLGRLMFAKQVEQDANSNFSGSGYTDPITSNNQWSVKYLYDDNGNIISTTDAKNVTTTASYDSINRLKVRDYSDSTPDVSFYYDGKGLSSVPDYSNGKTTKITSSVSENRYLTFDIFGHNLTARQTTASVNYDTAYTYNLSGALIEETYPSGRVVKNTIDSDGALSAVETKPAGGSYSARVNTFVYNSAGAATSFKFGNNRFENFAYNDRQQVTQIGLGTSSTDTSLLKLEYKYNTVGNTDNNGSMLEQKITVPTVGGSSGFTATQTYAYDGLNRLTSATETISSTQTWKQEFSYDRYGNKNFVTGSGHTTTLGACPAAQCNPSFNTATNRFSSGQGYTYDANGSLTVDATGQQYTLDAENRQTVLKDGLGNNLAEYTYDGEGKRVRKLIWSSGVVTHFVYDAGGTLIEEWTTTPAPEGTKDKPSVSTTSYVYAGSRLISTETGSGTTYVTVDHLGSTRVTTDGGGNVTSRKDFMAFGEEAITPERNVGVGYGIPPVRQDYTGYEKEAESGLEFAQARFQNPVHGRFTSVDPLTASATIKNPQTFNRYTYALNSPYKFTDPLGLLPNSSGGCSAEYSSCDENGNGKNVDEHADRIYQTQIARIEAQQAFAHGDIERGWQIIRESDGELMALDRNGNAVPDPNEPTVTITATVNPPDDDIPGNENVGITIVVWDAVIGLSTRILGHVSYIIDEKSYSFDASGYHPQDIGEYLNESLKISGATFYILDFGSKALNDKFKDLIKGEYTGDYSTYTGFNNCSSAFARSINAMRNELGTWTIRNTPAGVKKFITGSLSKYKFGQYRKEKLSP